MMYSIQKVWRNIYKNKGLYLLFVLQLSVGLCIISYVQSIRISENKAIEEAKRENPENEVLFSVEGNFSELNAPKFAHSDITYLQEKYRDSLRFFYAYKQDMKESAEDGRTLREYRYIYASKEYLNLLGIEDSDKVYAGKEMTEESRMRWGAEVLPLENAVTPKTQLWHQEPYDRYQKEEKIPSAYTVLIPMKKLPEAELQEIEQWGDYCIAARFQDMSKAAQICSEITEYFQSRHENNSSFQFKYFSPIERYVQQCQNYDVVLYIPELGVTAGAVVLVLAVGLGGAMSILTYRRRNQLAIALAMGAGYKTVIGEYIGEIALVAFFSFLISAVGGYFLLPVIRGFFYEMNFYNISYQPEAVFFIFGVTALVVFFTATVSLSGINYRNLVRLLREE